MQENATYHILATWYVYVHNNTLLLPNDVYYGANVMLYYTQLPTDHYLLYTYVSPIRSIEKYFINT